MQIKNRGQRGVRYWLLLFVTVNIWVILVRLILTMPVLGWLQPVAMLLLIYVGGAFFNAYRATWAPRFPLFYTHPDKLGFGYEEVTFNSRDGVCLSGWYVSPQNGAGVILCHGYGDNRMGMVVLARVLVRQGFGVLLFDLRSHGRSQGNLSTWGWLETNDLLGAVDYLLRRPEVDKGRIGCIGFSLGGQIALRTAAQMGRLRSVIVDSPSAATLDDYGLRDGSMWERWVVYPWLWCVYRFQALLIGVPAPAGVRKSIARIAPRPLLIISTGSRRERKRLAGYFQAAHYPKELWEIPEAQHGKGYVSRPEEYQQRLITFFTRTLLPEAFESHSSM